MKTRTRAALQNTFRAGITLKGIDGVLETLGGVLLWFIRPAAMNEMIRVLSQHDLSRDPRDAIMFYLRRATETLLHSNREFASMYLLSHGLSKVVLVVALWMNAKWAYPATIWFFALFGAYQMYRYSYTHSISMLVLTIFDVALIYLTWLEWREQKKAATAPSERE
jgi:uncharacterized membrane protein